MIQYIFIRNSRSKIYRKIRDFKNFDGLVVGGLRNTERSSPKKFGFFHDAVRVARIARPEINYSGHVCSRRVPKSL